MRGLYSRWATVLLLCAGSVLVGGDSSTANLGGEVQQDRKKIITVTKRTILYGLQARQVSSSSTTTTTTKPTVPGCAGTNVKCFATSNRGTDILSYTGCCAGYTCNSSTRCKTSYSTTNTCAGTDLKCVASSTRSDDVLSYTGCCPGYTCNANSRCKTSYSTVATCAGTDMKCIASSTRSNDVLSYTACCAGYTCNANSRCKTSYSTAFTCATMNMRCTASTNRVTDILSYTGCCSGICNANSRCTGTMPTTTTTTTSTTRTFTSCAKFGDLCSYRETIGSFIQTVVSCCNNNCENGYCNTYPTPTATITPCAGAEGGPCSTNVRVGDYLYSYRACCTGAGLICVSNSCSSTSTTTTTTTMTTTTTSRTTSASISTNTVTSTSTATTPAATATTTGASNIPTTCATIGDLCSWLRATRGTTRSATGCCNSNCQGGYCSQLPTATFTYTACGGEDGAVCSTTYRDGDDLAVNTGCCYSGGICSQNRCTRTGISTTPTTTTTTLSTVSVCADIGDECRFERTTNDIVTTGTGCCGYYCSASRCKLRTTTSVCGTGNGALCNTNKISGDFLSTYTGCCDPSATCYQNQCTNPALVAATTTTTTTTTSVASATTTTSLTSPTTTTTTAPIITTTTTTTRSISLQVYSLCAVSGSPCAYTRTVAGAIAQANGCCTSLTCNGVGTCIPTTTTTTTTTG